MASRRRVRFGLTGRGLVRALTALAATVAVIVGLVLAAGSGSYRATAVFDHVNGLVTGADVEQAGLIVGHVQRIWLGRDGLPHVEMNFGGGFRLRRGARADIRMTSLAGEFNRFISIYPGGGATLPDGSTIPAAATSQPVEIAQVLSTLTPRTRADVRDLLGGLDSSTRGTGAAIARTLAHSASALGNTAALLAEVNSDGQALRIFVHDGSAVMQTLAKDPGSLGALTDQLTTLLQATAARQADLTRTAELLAPGLRSPRLALQTLNGSLTTLDRFVRAAAPGVRELVPFARALSPTLRAAPPALRTLASLITQAPPQLDALAPLLRTTRPTLKVLEPVLFSAGPILDQLRVRLPDVFAFFANWADFTANYDANGHGARIGLVFPPAPAAPISPSQSSGGSLAPPFLRDPGVLDGQPWTNFASSFIAPTKVPK